MSVQCSKCRMNLDAASRHCPSCGASTTHAARQSSDNERHRVRGALGGLLFGLVTAPVLIIFGVMVCFTGWGLLLGLISVAAGVLAPIAGSVFGMDEYAGKCPFCGTQMIGIPDGKAHGCPVCTREFAFKTVHGKPA